MKKSIYAIIWFLVYSIFSCTNSSKQQKSWEEKEEAKINSQDLEILEIINEKYHPRPRSLNPIEASFNDEGKVDRINIKNLPIDRVPSEIFELNDIIALTFNGTKLKVIPDLSPLIKLNNLQMINCEISGKVVMPDYTARLKYFRLYSYRSKINDIIFPKNCSIERLGLGDNDISHINPSFLHLKDVKKINFVNNNLKKIDLSDLPNLEILILSGNPIENIDKVRSLHNGVEIIF